MNDEQFEAEMCALEECGHEDFVEAMRDRNAAQREALARMEKALAAKPAMDLANACIAQLIESGAENYVGNEFEFTVESEDVSRPVIVTVQFADRPSPYELRLKAEAERDAAQAQLAECLNLIRWFRAEFHTQGIATLVRNVDIFLAKAQAEQHEAREPVLARPEHGVALDEALELTMDRYSGALDKLAASEQQEAQGAQAVDLPKPKDPSEYRGSSSLYAKGWNDCLAALTTQPAVRGAEHDQ